MSYKPLATGSLNTTFSGGNLVGVGLGSSESFMVHTQYPHGFFRPQHCEGCEIKCPFIHPNEWYYLRPQAGGGGGIVNGLGMVTVMSMMSLTSSGAATANPVNVSVYAWVTDIELSGPSLVLTSGEVSVPLSTAARVANFLGRVPIIGGYARTAGSVLSGASGIAKWLGFTNTPLSGPSQPMRLNYASNICSPEVSSYIDKIAMDPGNELNVDPSPAGFGPEDQMSFAYIQDRDVYISDFGWSASATYDTTLWSAYVSPVAYINATGTGATTAKQYVRTQMTPGALLGQHFEYWNGEVEYIFKIACSQFHRGRIRITYEPSALEGNTIVAPAFTSPLLHQVIWDISESSEIRFKVPFMASSQYLECDPAPSVGSSTASPWGKLGLPAVPYNTKFFNGLIHLSVLNELAVDASVGAQIFVFINTKGVNYASPCDIASSGPYLQVVPLSEETVNGVPAERDVEVVASGVDQQMTDTYMGETVLSLRTMLHRSVLWDRLIASYAPSASFANINLSASSFTFTMTNIRQVVHKYLLPRFPIGAHICATPAIPTVSNANPDNTYPYSFIGNAANTIMFRGATCNTTPIALWSACYTGWRGSMVWRAFKESPYSGTNAPVCSWSMYPERTNWTKYMVSNTTGVSPLQSSPYTTMDGGFVTSFSSIAIAASDAAELWMSRALRLVGLQNNFGGMVKGTPQEVPSLECVLPHYASSKMYPSNFLTYQNYHLGPSGNTPNGDYYNFYMENVSSDTFAMESIVNNRATSVTTCIEDFPKFSMYVNTGPDFSLFGFLAVPTLYRYVTWYTDNSVLPYMAYTNTD